MRLGLFGGTFDPVHYGHLLAAECCVEACALDGVWFMPAASPPHKQSGALTAAEHRVEMLRLAIGGHVGWDVSRCEIDRGGVSYTVETLEQLHHEDAARELFFILGADSLADLATWREPARICQLSTLVVVARPGAAGPVFAPLGEVPRRKVVEMPQIGLSSTDIRQRVAAGKSIRYRTPRAVEKYIETVGLYR